MSVHVISTVPNEAFQWCVIRCDEYGRLYDPRWFSTEEQASLYARLLGGGKTLVAELRTPEQHLMAEIRSKSK